MRSKNKKVKAYNKSKTRTSKRPKLNMKFVESDDSDVNPDEIFKTKEAKYHEKKDSELSTDDELIQHKRYSFEEEVLPITDESDYLEQDSKVQDEEDLSNIEAYGKNKSLYYSADFVDQDRGRTYREEDAEAAKAEEKEALAIQKSLFSNIDMKNMGSHLIFDMSDESSQDEETIKEPVTKEEILRYMRKETKFYEYRELVQSTMQNLKKTLKLWCLIDMKLIRSKQVLDYVKLRKEILALLLHNIIMYFMFLSEGKDRHQSLKHHPVHKRIAQFKELFDVLEAKDPNLASIIDLVLEKHENGEVINITSDVEDNSIESSQSEPETMKKLSKVKTKKREKEVEKREKEMENCKKEMENCKKEMENCKKEMEKREKEMEKREKEMKKEMEMLKQKNEPIAKRTNPNHRQSTSYSNGGGPSNQEEIIVPRPAVGVVIGKRGKRIKGIQRDSGASVKFIEGNRDIHGNKVCQITGSIDQVAKASSLIRELIKSVTNSKVQHVETENEKQVLTLIKGVKEEVRIRKHEKEDESDQDSDDDKIAVNQGENDEKRLISYKIAKNKGLVPHRKKEYRNPRVRHRMKYRKAQISRKGQVREVVKEIKRYEGEATGINKNVVKSVKFK